MNEPSPTAPVYSERLGAIADAQFAAAAARHGLGDFLGAEPIAGGLFGQNVFVRTTQGEFVLRGAPHWLPDGHGGWRPDDRVQFAVEHFFIKALYEHTSAPVPWPSFYDPAPDIFGWPYLIMPRMPGLCFDPLSIRKALAPAQRRDVAVSMGATLAELQRLGAPAAGVFDVDLGAVAPDPNGFGGHLVEDLSRQAEKAEAAGVMTGSDMQWIADLSRSALSRSARPVTFTHGDYKLDNTTVCECDGVWRVSGLFDFHTARFGDSAFDLVRPMLFYSDFDAGQEQVMLDAWRGAGGDEAGLAPWLPLYVAAERIGLWATFVSSASRPRWSEGRTFRTWAEPYLERLATKIR